MSLITEGLMLGLSTGPYCFAACAPFLVPFLLAQNQKTFKPNLFALFYFFSGRLLAYIFFAAAVSAAGSIANPSLPKWLTGSGLIIAAAIMLAYSAVPNFPKMSACAAGMSNPAARKIPFIAGFLMGINICPPFITGFLRLLAIADIYKGVVFFLSFFTATSLYLMPALLVVPAMSERLRGIGKTALFLCGLWYLFSGVKNFL